MGTLDHPVRATILLLCLIPCAWLSAGQPTMYLELNQMLSVSLGTEWGVSDRGAVRASVGTGAGFPTTTCAIDGVWHLRAPTHGLLVDLELGVPLAYANPFEGRWIDWDPNIDRPFAGFLFGGGLVSGYRGARFDLTLLTGLAAWWEWQDGRRHRGPEPMPVVAARVASRRSSHAKHDRQESAEIDEDQ